MPFVDLERTMITASDGVALAVHSSRGEGRTALLVHGFTLDHRSWSAVWPSLASRGMPVVAVDLRGHGQSGLGTAPPDIRRIGDDAFDVLGQLGLSDVVVVGHSLGAFVALGMRADPRAASHVRGVVAISGMATSIRNPFVKAGARFFGSQVGARVVRHPQLGRSMLRTWFRKGAPDSEIETVRQWSAECPPNGRSAVGRSTTRIDLRPGLGAPGPPTLVLCGTDDRATPTKHSQEIVGAINGATLLLIPNAGHMVITEQPTPVSAAILRHGEKVDGR